MKGKHRLGPSGPDAGTEPGQMDDEEEEIEPH